MLGVWSSGAQALGLGRRRAGLLLPCLAGHLHRCGLGRTAVAARQLRSRPFSQDPSRLRVHGGGEQQHGADEEAQAGMCHGLVRRGEGALTEGCYEL
jgi:hypothetical protein